MGLNSKDKVDYESASTHYDASRSAGPLTTAMLAGLLQLRPDSSVLDIGCGTGNFMLALRGKARRITGVDLSAGMLAKASDKGLGLDLLLADAHYLPFGDETFDAAYATQVLHHLQDKLAALREAYRVLKPGGRLALQFCTNAQLATFCCYHYFPAALQVDKQRIPDAPVVLGLLGEVGFTGCSVKACPMEGYANDRFYAEDPADYLNEIHRAGNSTFSFLTKEEVDAGCAHIRADLTAGRTQKIAEEFEKLGRKVGRVSFAYGKKPDS